MFFEDLGTDAYHITGEAVRAVGWLDPDYEYTQGPVAARFCKKLEKHSNSAWAPFAPAGFHRCEFCPPDVRETGSGFVFIPTSDFLYVAPELIVHYITKHEYQPPEEFIAAVKECPPQGSTEFMKLVRKFEPYWRDDR